MYVINVFSAAAKIKRLPISKGEKLGKGSASQDY